MSTLQNALRPALTPALGSAIGGVSRYFTEFSEVAQSYVSIGTGILLGANALSIDIDFATDSSRSLVSGDSGVDVIDININGGLVRAFARVGGVLQDVLVGTTNVIDSKLHRASITYDAGSVSLWVDGAIEATGNWALNGSQVISTIGFRPANNTYFLGIIANVKIIDNGITALSMPINRYYTPQRNVVLDESGNGNNGTFVNIAAGRSKYYQQRADGNFVDLQGNVLEVAY